MATSLIDTFPRAVARALERMAFVIVQPAATPVDRVLPRCCDHARIGFHSDGARDDRRPAVDGWLCVALTSGLVVEIAGGLLGLDKPSVAIAEHGPSTAQELANVLGGELVMALGGAERPIRLGLPQNVEATAAAQHFVPTGTRTTCVLQSAAGFLLVAFDRT